MQGQFASPYFVGGSPSGGEWGVGDYVGDAEGTMSPSGHAEGMKEFQNPFPSYDFRWNMGEIIMAVLDSGLALTVLREYPYCNGAKVLQGAQLLSGRRWTLPEGRPTLPLMYGLVARKQGE